MNRFWVLLGLVAALTGCAPITQEEIQEQESDLGSFTRTDTHPAGVTPPDSVVVTPNLSQPPTMVGVDLVPACECHLNVYDNSGLVCVRMVCAESCSERTRRCATLFGGCTTR
jgi:hypothetical protein